MINVGLVIENKSLELLIPLKTEPLIPLLDARYRLRHAEYSRRTQRVQNQCAPIRIQISHYVKESAYEFSRTSSNREHDSVIPLIVLGKS